MDKAKKIVINLEQRSLELYSGDGVKSMALYSTDSFEVISDLWLKVGWNQKYTYTFTWLGRPIVQLPEDMIRAQEAIYRIRPDVIIETGVAHGGSLIFYASLCKLLGKGRVIGIDIEIRPHNRVAIQSHFLSDLITLIEGDSVAKETVEKVRSLVKPGEVVMVFLDSNHTKQHVLDELENYCDLVSPESYIVVNDGIMRDLFDVPRGKKEWLFDNPYEAVKEFVSKHPEFEIEEPTWLFNESYLKRGTTYWPCGWIRRKK